MNSPRITLRPGDRVLVSRLDYLGDVLLSLPLCDALLARWPGIRLDYLTRRPAADLLADDPRFDTVLRAERGAGVAANLRLVTHLRKAGYKGVIDLYSNPRSAWLSWLSAAGVRVGVARRGRRHLYTDAITVAEHVRSAVEIYQHYGAPLGVEVDPSARPTYRPTREALERGARALDRAGSKSGPRVGIHPGGKWSVKRWPVESFAVLADRMRERLGASLAVLTGPGEEAYSEQLCALVGNGAHHLPVLDIVDVAGVVAQLDAMVACDGGIMHLSVAVGTPTVGIFGSSEPEIWFPYEGSGPYRAACRDMPCRPCHAHTCPLGHTGCLNDLSPDDVLACVESVWPEPGRSRA